MRNKKGFTLVEIIIVIVILGIITIVAIPKYIDLKTEARRSTLQGVAGAMSAASTLWVNKARVAGVSPYGAITLDGTTIGFSKGYVAGKWAASWEEILENENDITKTDRYSVCQDTDLCVEQGRLNWFNPVTSLPVPQPPASNIGKGIVIWLNGMKIADNCYAFYFNQETPPDPPIIGIVDSGCTN